MIENHEGRYCGWVNAKNSYGGYSGFVRFYGLFAGEKPDGSPGFFVFTMGGNARDDAVTAKMCADAGY